MSTYSNRCIICGDTFITHREQDRRCFRCRTDHYEYRPPTLSKPPTQKKLRPKKKVNVEQQKRQAKSNYLKKYGMTIEHYEKMYKDQKGKCAACKRHFEKLVVDHDHTTGQVRALLCNTCNFTYGMLYEDPKYIERLLQYARQHWQPHKRFGH